MPENLLADGLINSPNLTTHGEQLIKASISKLSYDIAKYNLIKVFSEDNPQCRLERVSHQAIGNIPCTELPLR